MTGNKSLFSTYKAYDGGNVVFGSNLKGKIIDKGVVSTDSLAISNVEHVDNLAFNLLSVGQICDNKCKVLLTEDGSEIIKNDKIIDHGWEFYNEVQIGAFCDAQGITHNFSAPHTPQSNGVVERKNHAL
ncbi:retrovirus-related pol polyprotein from transposon TNT 1-94 [Tanacetum coccineum]